MPHFITVLMSANFIIDQLHLDQSKMFGSRRSNMSDQESNPSVAERHSKRFRELSDESERSDRQEDMERQLFQMLYRMEHEYQASPQENDYLVNQSYSSAQARANTVHWLMRHSTFLRCHREIFANAISLMDRYFARIEDIAVHELQDIAVACLALADQQENINFPSINIGIFRSKGALIINQKDFNLLKKKISVTLRFKLSAPTLNAWSNILASFWDRYVDKVPCHPKFRNIRFKVNSAQSYTNFRWMINYVDFTLLDIKTYQFPRQNIAIALLYLTLLIRLDLHPQSQLAQKIIEDSKTLSQVAFDQLFDGFLVNYFKKSLECLRPEVLYCSKFMILPVLTAQPPVRSGQVIRIEECRGIQTFNEWNFDTFLQLRNQ